MRGLPILLVFPARPAPDHSPGNLCRYAKGKCRTCKWEWGAWETQIQYMAKGTALIVTQKRTCRWTCTGSWVKHRKHIDMKTYCFKNYEPTGWIELKMHHTPWTMWKNCNFRKGMGYQDLLNATRKLSIHKHCNCLENVRDDGTFLTL